MAVFGQYFYNGEGYEDSSLLASAVFLSNNPQYNGLSIADESAQPEDYEGPPELDTADLLNWGRHYAAISISWSDMLDSEIGLSLFALTNMGDLSGLVTCSISFPVFDVFHVSIGGRLSFGDPGDEFTNQPALLGGSAGNEDIGSTLSLSMDVSMGGGNY